MALVWSQRAETLQAEKKVRNYAKAAKRALSAVQSLEKDCVPCQTLQKVTFVG